jgi:hypothetical protein
MMSNSPVSCDSTQSSETCIVCLDDVNENTIWLPSFYSSCTCKYALHIECIKEYNITSCLICKADLNYPVDVNEITIDIFKNKQNTPIKELSVSTEITNNYTDENIQRCVNIRVLKRLICYMVSIFITCGFIIFLWYVVRPDIVNVHSTTSSPNRMLLLTNNV